jgi:hypothetical protein
MERKLIFFVGIFKATDEKSRIRIMFQIWTVFRLRIRIRISDPDPLVRGMDPDPAPDPSIIMQK